jgi:hypothetical protein
MRGVVARRAGALRSASLLIGVLLFLGPLLGACGHHRLGDAGGDNGVNAYPANYKSDILSAMHAYLNNPTGIRDAALSEPAIKTLSGTTRYMACLRFNAKKSGSNDYAGVKEIVAVFLAGRFDQFVENSKDVCAGVTYQPYPELQNLPP